MLERVFVYFAYYRTGLGSPVALRRALRLGVCVCAFVCLFAYFALCLYRLLFVWVASPPVASFRSPLTLQPQLPVRDDDYAAAGEDDLWRAWAELKYKNSRFGGNMRVRGKLIGEPESTHRSGQPSKANPSYAEREYLSNRWRRGVNGSANGVR